MPQDGEYERRAAGRPKALMARDRRHPLRAAPHRGTGSQRRPRGRAWHEGGVGTISFWDKDGEHLKTIYVARMPESGKGTLADKVEATGAAGRSRRPPDPKNAPDAAVGPARDGGRIPWPAPPG